MDQEHADAVKQAAAALNKAMGEAGAHGLECHVIAIPRYRTGSSMIDIVSVRVSREFR